MIKTGTRERFIVHVSALTVCVQVRMWRLRACSRWCHVCAPSYHHNRAASHSCKHTCRSSSQAWTSSTDSSRLIYKLTRILMTISIFKKRIHISSYQQIYAVYHEVWIEITCFNIEYLSWTWKKQRSKDYFLSNLNYFSPSYIAQRLEGYYLYCRTIECCTMLDMFDM